VPIAGDANGGKQLFLLSIIIVFEESIGNASFWDIAPCTALVVDGPAKLNTAKWV